MIDCHAHLADESFERDLDDVIRRAKNNGVESIVVVAEYPEDCDRVLEIAKKYPNFCYPSIGVHPVQKVSRSVTLEDLKSIESYFASFGDEICAVGEVGLDFTPRYVPGGDEDKKSQREVFKQQIDIANRLNIPVNVHSRSAGKPVIDWLLQNRASKAILHAFSGNPKNARMGIEAGYFFSIPPSFATNPDRAGLVKAVPLEQLCLETDSPVLGPSRDQRNEPMNVQISAEFIAKVKDIPLSEVIRVTTNNAKRLFRFIKT